ncbi:MAG: hypothetical protein IT431_01190 [Phycisphaerales bacterium]|nr:hypothetical protein [Phycisphaerales bacterium]
MARAGDLHARPTLVPERMAALPGETVWVAVDFELDEGWHTYWPGVNDTGFALDTVVGCSANAAAGEMVWPAPHRYTAVEGILDHVFEERMTVLLPVTVAADAVLGESVTVSLDMRWLVCKTACVLEDAERSVTIPVSDAVGKPSRETAELFERARARVAPALADGDPVSLSFAGSWLELRGEGAVRMAFYPLAEGRETRDLLRDGEAEGDRLRVEYREGEGPVRGVLEVWSGPKESKLYAVEWPKPDGEVESETPAPTDGRANE